ncbi:helicase-related protein [Vibrio parahaemolyticus]|uniref:helicase-related protein n=1 Tax=Vibrio mediterranei TaxID=689 RepID=UPI00406895DE
MTTLPIESIKTDFQQQLKFGHLIVEAETGSGKSTQLPIWAMTQGRVLVVEPRRIACTSLAGFVAESLGESVGNTVGYAIKLENRYQESSQIVFVTPGVALNWFAEDGMRTFDIVMVDEFHERRWDTDLLVAMLKQTQAHKTIITSATLEGEKLARYFNANRLVAEGRNFDVKIEHRRTDSRQLPDSRHLEQRVKAEVEAQIETLSGDILVFLPGRKEIQQVSSALKGLQGEYDLMIAPLHASVTEQERQIAMTTQPHRKVVLATNVAETSLTIPNVELVIDSGLERRNVQRNGQTTLMLTHISKASAAQRAGRAGRVMNGVCIRLYGEHAALESVTPPELQRESIVEPMLASAQCGFSIGELAFIDSIPEKSLRSASEQLSALGALDDNGITEHGKRLAPLPVDAVYADLISKMPTKPLKEVMIDLTAAICATGKLYQLTSNEELLEKLEREEPIGCDAEIMVGLVRGKQFAGVAVEPDCLREAKGLSNQMRAAFELPLLEVASRYDRREWLRQIVMANASLLFIRRERRKEAMSNGHLEVILGRQTRLKSKYETGLVLSTHSLPGRGVKQTMTLATLVMPVDLSLVIEAEVGHWVSGDTVDTGQGIQTRQTLNYAGRIITERLTEPKGDIAVPVMAKAIVDQQLFEGLAPRIRQQLEHWKLYVDLGLSANDTCAEAVSLVDWFTTKLIELGVESFDDLELIDEGDFIFQGIPDWEYSDFAAKYPLEVQLSGMKLTIEYLGKGKLVQVHHHSGSRKEDPKRKELPAWSGWRVRYKKASRVIDLK